MRWESKTISGSGTFVTEWSYNSADRAAWMRYPADNNGVQGEQVTFTYAPQMLIKTAIGATTYVKNTTYDAAGRSDMLNLGLNPNTSNAYMYLDYNYYAWNVQGGRVQWLQAVQTGSSALLQKLEYAYDAAGNVDWIKDYLAGSPYQTQDFTYDLLNRLDAASATGGDGQGLYNENYDYDSQGNLWKKGTVGSETVYTYLDGNHKHAVTHLGGAPMYGYDPNGNMTTRKVGATTYTQGWDAENRLVSVSGAGVSASFSYDGDGVRVKGTVNGTVTAYVGNWFEWTGSTSTMKKYYYAGSQRIAMRSGSGTGTSGLLWIIGDHLGSTTKIANADGSINSQRRYKPWGEARFGGALPTTYRYTGQRQEDLLGGADGLYYYGARWYDAALGRFISADSTIPGMGIPAAWDRYSYAFNRPNTFIDPSGHWPELSFLNPFSYDTVSVTFEGLAKVVIGVDLDINISVDTRPVREGYAFGGVGGAIDGLLNTQVAVNVEANIDVGVSAEAAIGVGVTGSDGGVLDSTGLNLIGKEGVPINYGAAIPPGISVHGTTVLDPNSNNGVASSQTWTVGAGEGFDVSATLANLTDSAAFFDGSSQSMNLQFPFFNENYVNEFLGDLNLK